MDPKSSNSNLSDDLDTALDDDPKEELEKEESPDDEKADETGEVEEEEAEGKKDKDKEDDEEVTDDTEKPKVPSLVTRAKTKYPGIFKEFPELKEAYFKKQEYEQVFGSVEDAREAAAVSETMTELASALREGNVEPLMDTIYEEDPEALKAMAMSFLPTLHKKSNRLFSMIVTPLISNMFSKIAKTAIENDNEDLLLAVRYCTRAAGLGTDIPRPMRMGVPKRDDSIDEERRNLASEKESMFFDNTESVTEPVIDEEILKGLDPDGALPEGLREATIAAIRKDIYKTLSANESYMRRMAALRKAAAASGYNKEYQKKVSKAVIEAARELIPAIRAKHRKRMLGNLVKDRKTDTPAVPNADGSPAIVGGSNKKNVDIDWKTTSIRDALDKVV